MARRKIIQVNNLTKSFRINTERNDTIKMTFMNILKRNEYRQFMALEEINFSVERGEFLGIIGKNGSGKSTLLKVISEIYLPNQGEIKTMGHIVPFLELGVGFNPDLSARENIFLNGVILGLTRREVKEKFDDIVEFAEIEGFLDTPVKNFSSGMYVRLAFSIAMQVEGDIYILDEVLSVGDIGFQEKSINKLEELINSGATVIFVSHSMEQIKKYCSRLLVLNNGKLIHDGNVDKGIKIFTETFK